MLAAFECREGLDMVKLQLHEAACGLFEPSFPKDGGQSSTIRKARQAAAGAW